MADYYSEGEYLSGPSADEMDALREQEEEQKQQWEGELTEEETTVPTTPHLDLKSTFRKIAPPKKKTIFKPEKSAMKAIFTDSKKDNNVKQQRKMMAAKYGSSRDIPTSADMSLDTLNLASRMGIQPHHIALLGRSARVAQEQTARVVRPALHLGQIDRKGKLKKLDESIEQLISCDIDLSSVDSIFETSHFKKAKEWLVKLQQTPTWPASEDARFVSWLTQLYTECFGTMHVYGKVATAFTALLDEIEDPELRKKFQALTEVLVNGNAIIQQHQPMLRSMKTAITYKADPKAWKRFNKTLGDRSENYKLSSKDKQDTLQQYNDLIIDPEGLESSLNQSRKRFNWKREKNREEKRKRKDSRDYTRDYRNSTGNRGRGRGRSEYDNRDNRDRNRTKDRGRGLGHLPRKPFIRPKDAICHNCGKRGHKASHCPTMKCQNCGAIGHSVTTCPKRQGPKN